MFAEHHNQTARARRGMTLIEILTIIMIIAMLMSILVPAIGKFQQQAAQQRTRILMGTIGTAIEAYKNDFNDYPPSKAAGTIMGTLKGSSLLPVFLIGYKADAGSDGKPGSGEDMLVTDDGKDGPGFRLAHRGKVYGPYNDADKLPMDKSTYPQFIDSMDQAILYYRYRDKDSDGVFKYWDDDAPAGDTKIRPGDITKYAKAGQTELLRRDYLLISKGLDGTYGTTPTGGDSKGKDDITNFTN